MIPGSVVVGVTTRKEGRMALSKQQKWQSIIANVIRPQLDQFVADLQNSPGFPYQCNIDESDTLGCAIWLTVKDQRNCLGENCWIHYKFNMLLGIIFVSTKWQSSSQIRIEDFNVEQMLSSLQYFANTILGSY